MEFKCDICGGMLEMDASGQFAKCEFCGMKYPKERLQAIIQEIRGKVTVEGTVQARQTGTEEDVKQWKLLLRKYMSACDYSSAISVVKKILEAVPGDAEANEIYDNLQELQYFDIRNGTLVKYSGKSSYIVIPDGVTKITQHVFRHNAEIEKVIMSNSIEEVENESFLSCAKLQEIVIGSKVRIIPGGIFEGCSSLKSIIVPDSVEEIRGSAFKDCSALISVKFPKKLLKIGEKAFYGCKSLSEIIIPDSVEEIQGSAFEACSALISVEFSKKLLKIGEKAFYGCESLERVVLASALKQLEYGLFAKCVRLEEMVMPDTILSIGESTFERCSSLKSITIPDNVLEIGEKAFDGCGALSIISLPKGLLKIGSRAFRKTSIHELKIPDEVKNVECLEGCYELEELHASTELIERYRDVYYEKDWRLYVSKWQEKMNVYKQKGRCEYCGGKILWFEGTCKECGRFKKYFELNHE